MTIRPNYDAPARLAYINKVIQQYHRLPIELVRGDGDGYHTLFYRDGGVQDEESIYVPYTSHMPLGRWVQEAIGFAQRVRGLHGDEVWTRDEPRGGFPQQYLDDPVLGRESELRPGFYEEDME